MVCIQSYQIKGLCTWLRGGDAILLATFLDSLYIFFNKPVCATLSKEPLLYIFCKKLVLPVLSSSHLALFALISTKHFPGLDLFVYLHDLSFGCLLNNIKATSPLFLLF